MKNLTPKHAGREGHRDQARVTSTQDITPGPLLPVKPGETRIYFAVPTCYTIGYTFASYKEAADAARGRIKTFEYGGCSREFVDVRIADVTGDRMLHRVEVFK